MLRDVTLTIEAGDRWGLVGVNGTGKTTLIRILTGREEPDSGEIQTRRDLSVVAVDQLPDLDPRWTVRQAVLTGLETQQRLREELESLAGSNTDEELARQAELSHALEQLGGWDFEHKAEAVMTSLGLPPPDRAVEKLSLGEQRRVAICIGLLKRPDLLILDEPTNHLDVQAIEWLERTLTNYPGALLLVTHDRYFLDRIATRLAELDRGGLRTYEGNYTAYMVERAERLALEARSERNRLRAIRSELDWVRSTAPARTSKSKARLQRFDALIEAKPELASGPAELRLPHPTRIGKKILELRNLSKAYDQPLVQGLDLILKKGDRIGVVGRNGVGKSTLVKMIMAEVTPDGGEVICGQNTKIIYADQARSDLDPENTVLEEVAGDNDYVRVGDQMVTIQSFLARLLFSDSDQRAKVAGLSGGERSRVALAKSLREAGNLLILDEPTNDLDLPTLRVLEEALSHYPGCAIVVSHDRYFLDRVATAILAFEGEGQIVLYEGDHSAYAARKKATSPEAPKAARSSKPREAKAKTKRSYHEEREFEGMEAKILEAEEEVAALEAELNDPQRVRELGSEIHAQVEALEARKKRVEELYARWEALGQIGS